MFRPLVGSIVVLALSSLVGCAGSSHQAVQHSLAEQVPVDRVAYTPPTDFEFEVKGTESASPARFTHDKELTGSLHHAVATRPDAD